MELQHAVPPADRRQERRAEDVAGHEDFDDRPEDIPTASEVLQRAQALAKRVADIDAGVLIQGENGTGKSVLARCIHEWSPRRKAAFATVSCPSLSAELLASELFGHVRGAFTGATDNRPGRIQVAEGGTLFLDEIG
ncbi:MAG: sigma 54-interacting transcriptional regulator, partial [Solimonas sp.]